MPVRAPQYRRDRSAQAGGNARTLFETGPDCTPDTESWPAIEDVFDAYFKCRINKRNTVNQLTFEQDLERNLVKLWRDLHTGSYRINPGIAFVVTRPKIREIWAADFRDRIVHHLIYNAIFPRFMNAFIRDSYACIPGRGMHDGMRRASKFARSVTHNHARKGYVAKIDIANFFNSIDKTILEGLLMRRAGDHPCREILCRVLHHDPRIGAKYKSTRKMFRQVPQHKSLLHAPAHIGLPIGNLTSQFFANVYLHELDRHVKHDLGIRYYGRYVDDMVLFDPDPVVLRDAIGRIDDFLRTGLNLALNPSKTCLNKVSAGFDFCGFWIKPGRIYLRRTTWNNAKSRSVELAREVDYSDSKSLKTLQASINSYLGMLGSVDGYRARQALCASTSSLFLTPGSDFTKMDGPPPG